MFVYAAMKSGVSGFASAVAQSTVAMIEALVAKKAALLTHDRQ
jgi:hypothetical protein